MFSFRCSGLGAIDRVSFVRDGDFEKDPLHHPLSLHSLRQFCRHSRVHLDRRARLAFLEDPDRQVSGSRPDFEDDIGGAQIRLVDDSVAARLKSVC